MRNAWAATLEQFLHSQTFPMWMTLAAAVFFAVILLVTLIRAEKTVANGALTVITLLAVGIAVAATVQRFGPPDGSGDGGSDGRMLLPAVASVPALSCLDGLAGEGVEAPCERSLFTSADIAAAAVSYTAAQISRLAPLDRPAARTPEQQSLRKTLERDRYGLVAQVLTARDHCSENDCKLFALFADPSRIKANMRDHVYDLTIGRYALAWAAGNASAMSGATSPMITSATAGPAPQAAPVPGSLTGKPVEFPNAASIPPVNIMAAEPPAQAAPQATAKPAAAAKPATSASPQPAKPAAAKKQTAAAPKPKSVAAPTSIAPAESDDN